MAVMGRLTEAALLVALLAPVIFADPDPDESSLQGNRWTDSFNLEDCEWTETGSNMYFIMQPGYQLILTGTEDDDTVTLVITVLDEVEKVGGVRTRVVEERESANGSLVEVSRNSFAICRNTSSVFYFGEDVDIYKMGEVVSHEGSWRAGQSDFRPGLMIPGLVLAGASYYQEIAPGIAMDRAKIICTDTTVHTSAGVFDHCIVTEETSALEPDAREFKIYAPGVGIIKDGNLWLTGIGWVVDRKH